VTSGLLIDVREEDIKLALRSAYIANRAALACTYGDIVTIEPTEEPEGINPHADMVQVFEDIGLLLYNCVSNDGRDFMPQRDKGVLESISTAIAWHMVKQGGEVRA
jgi:hypothetical protein